MNRQDAKTAKKNRSEHYRKLNPRQQQAVAEIITALAAKDRRR